MAEPGCIHLAQSWTLCVPFLPMKTFHLQLTSSLWPIVMSSVVILKACLQWSKSPSHFLPANSYLTWFCLMIHSISDVMNQANCSFLMSSPHCHPQSERATQCSILLFWQIQAEPCRPVTIDTFSWDVQSELLILIILCLPIAPPQCPRWCLIFSGYVSERFMRSWECDLCLITAMTDV